MDAFEFEGKKYILTAETDRMDTCSGCAFSGKDGACTLLLLEDEGCSLPSCTNRVFTEVMP